jgi:hypothetical protein
VGKRKRVLEGWHSTSVGFGRIERALILRVNFGVGRSRIAFTPFVARLVLRILLLALQVRDRGNASGGNRGGTCFKKIATGKLSFTGVLRQSAPPACRIDTGFLRKGELNGANCLAIPSKSLYDFPARKVKAKNGNNSRRLITK